MKKHNKSDPSLSHQKAEGEFKGRLLNNLSGYSEIDLVKLVHELQVHQIELEMQKQELMVANEKAEAAVIAKQQFLSNMSHEIRTPMNAIIGFTKILLKSDLTDTQKEYLQAIKVSGDTLTVLINDILDLAKVQAGKMTFEKRAFQMEESISAMVHLFDIKAQEKNLELVKKYDNKVPKFLIGDPVRLHQIILNLISNAIKFTPTGNISVSVNLLNENDEKVVIEFTVTDTGIGIAEDKIKNIFENFEQANTGTSRLYGGTGLGLAIAKQLVESQGGTINLKSKLNVGTTFSFILSFQKTNDTSEIEEEILELDSKIRNLNVLVVEDVALNQLLIKTLLNDYGFNYDMADNGKIAIEKMQTNTYDIILMDLMMPEMNGFEATEYIRNTMNSKTPIIALTADVTTVDFAKCKAFGMDDYISKPVDEILLYNKIISLVEKPTPIEYNPTITYEDNQNRTLKYVDLVNLNCRTKSDPKLLIEMISIYLKQTPPLIVAMKQSLYDKDWNSLQSTVNKMIPSFSIMGISKDFENIAIRIQEDADKIQRNATGIPALVLQLENICTQACKELEEEFNIIKNNMNTK